MIQCSEEERRERHDRVHHQLKELFHINDMNGVEVFSSLARVAQLSEMFVAQQDFGQDISTPRWRLMLYLFMAEQLGNTKGLTPTDLSQFHQVSKNTISSLLRGLEEQGYILRNMDPEDLRVFRIHLSETGREFILQTAPERIEGLNQLLTNLGKEEVQQLILLLNKLRRSLEEQLCQVQKDQN